MFSWQGGDMIPNTLTFTIPGRPITSKNHGIMVKGRSLFLPSKQFRAYKDFCIGTKKRPGWLMQYGNRQFTGPVRLDALYWFTNYANWPDLMGLIQATADILEAAGLVKNDRQIVSLGNSRIVGLGEPRAEITISDHKCEWWRW